MTLNELTDLLLKHIPYTNQDSILVYYDVACQLFKAKKRSLVRVINDCFIELNGKELEIRKYTKTGRTSVTFTI